MAKLSMKCHPDTPAEAVRDFTVEVESRRDDQVWIRYTVEVPLDELQLDETLKPERMDGLWKTTCFEAFVKPEGSAGYCEFNFAPSGAWAAYRFSGYREGMDDLPMASIPALTKTVNESHFVLEALFALAPEHSSTEVRLAVTAVIEEANGTKSYWSLAHPHGSPDFHHPDCFTLSLPARAGT